MVRHRLTRHHSYESAATNGFDVVLIDTAGRMQNNRPLMQSLAKVRSLDIRTECKQLVALNSPQKLVFVGEALVGNEAVDQLSQFNKSLLDVGCPRRIDGIILTKFDTIDDKVGAALSMTYTARAPIIFLGTGQTYTDLRKMDAPSVMRSLMK